MPHFYINNARDQAAYIADLIYYGESLANDALTNNYLAPRRLMRELAYGYEAVTDPEMNAREDIARRKFFAAVQEVMPTPVTALSWRLQAAIEEVSSAGDDSAPVDLGTSGNARMATIFVTVPKRWAHSQNNRSEYGTYRITLVGYRGNYPTVSGAPANRNFRADMSSSMADRWVVEGNPLFAAMEAARNGEVPPAITDLVINPFQGDEGSASAFDISPSPEALAGVNPRVIPFTTISLTRRMINNDQARTGISGSVYVGPGFEVEPLQVDLGVSALRQYLARHQITAQSLIEAGRDQYRMWALTRLRNRVDEISQAREAAQAEHRQRAERAFGQFRERNMVTDQLIPTLPFVPHGLASSRRWGIEVESGGARGVSAPQAWDRKTDGSLRSAWEGYREVQDFEPYDEEVSEVIQWTSCANFERHMPHEQYFDEARNEYLFRIREDYLPANECAECGARTRTVRREPETITHRAQRDDCAEFVSPILVSMHSNGLEFLTTELSKQPQNNSAGVHVHVEARDLDNKQLATLLVGYDMMERFIDASYQRTRRDFCERRSAQSILALARKLKRGEEITGDDIVRERRYVTTNTHSLNRHGTVEFRAMGPVYDYNYLVRWAMFCREMVNLAAAGVTFKQFSRVKSWSDLLALFAKYGKEYLRASVYEMTGETGHQAALSKEGAPLTQDAVNSDLQALLDAGNVAHAAAASLARLGISFDEATARLVAVNHELATV